MTAVLTLALGLLLPAPEPIRIAVAPLVVTAPCKFAGPDIEQTRQLMSAAVMDYLDRACTAADIVFVDPLFVRGALEEAKVDFEKAGERKRERLLTFGQAARANYAILILVEGTDQKNGEMRAIAANAGGLHSTNKVRVRIWLHNVTDDLLKIDGAKNLVEGEAKGPYFGTVNPRDMSGDPESKGIVIRNEYRQRGKALGKALVQAVKSTLSPILGLKDPPP